MKHSKYNLIIIISLFISLLCSTFTEAAKIKGYVKNFNGKKILLGWQSSLTLIPVDSTKCDSGKFQFDISKRRPGIYSLIFDHGVYLDLVINNNEDIEFKTSLINKSNLEDSLKFINSIENIVYYDYIKYKNSVLYRISYEKWLGSKWYSENAQKNALKLDSLRNHIELLEKSISVKAENLIRQFPNLYVVKKLRFYLTPNFEDYKRATGDRKYNSEFEFLQEHYYDYINVSDTNILDLAHLNNMAQMYITNYIGYQNTSTFIKSCDFILKKMMPNKDVLCSVLDILTKKMEEWEQDSAYMHLADNYYAKGYCDSDPRKPSAIKISNMIKDLLPGKPFPNITLKDSTGKEVNLYSLKNKATLVFFWVSWCDHCEKMIPEVKYLYDFYKKKGFDIYAISMDEEKDLWINALKRKNVNWINVAELKGFNGTVAKQFNMWRTPRLYLIDKDKKVIARIINPNQLKDSLEKYFSTQK